MQDNAPPPPPRPAEIKTSEADQSRDATIVDMRDVFAGKTALTTEEVTAANAFIDGKIEMVRRDPRMTDDEKTLVTAELESKRPIVPTKTKP